jgi:alanyl-tRNA synthetase
MNNRSFDDILSIFFSTASKNGFIEKERQKLISSHFHDEFNLSAGHQYLKPILKSEKKEPIDRMVINEPCLRRMDIERIMSSSLHLLLFEMGVFGVFGYIEDMQDEETVVIATLLEFLEKAGIDQNKLTFTTSLGAKINGQVFIEDSISSQILLNQGIGEDKIIKTHGRQNFIYSKGDERPSGYSVEVFYNHSDNNFIEIASINIYKYLYQNGILIPSIANTALGCGIGFERVLSIINNGDSIFDLDPFNSFIKSCKILFENSKIHYLVIKRLAVIMELIKALSFIIFDGKTPDNTPQGKIMKSFLRKLNSEISYLDLPFEKVLEFGLYHFQHYYRSRYDINDDERNRILAIIMNNYY